MADNDTTPVVILAFANDQDDYLKNIRRERQGVFGALRAHNDRRSINVYKEEETSIEDLFKLFALYADRIAIFHYGGHANGTALRLEAMDGSAQQANSAGLAQLLGLQKGLKLVFLNGCATQGQVETLLASGVKAVIATAVPINDAMATEFAEQFYGALGNRASIGRAFDTARAYVTTRYGKEQQVASFRGFNWAGKAEKADAGLTWGLYVNDNGDDVLGWQLPEAPENQVIIRGAPRPTKGGPAVNTGLIVTLLQAVAPHSLKVRQALEIPKDSEDYDERIFPQLIMDSFPAPVGEQLRKLFASDTVDVARLRQLVVTYETVAKLFCFTMLSQLWNARFDNPALVVSDEQWAVCNSFIALTPDSQPTFDYFRLITTLVAVMTANGVVPFMVECAGLEAALGDEESTLAHRFMEEMRGELQRGRVAAEEIESFCVQAEAHLGTLLADFAFVVKYKFATIKSIDIVKSRHKAPEYVHRQILLDRVTAGFKDSVRNFAGFTDNESVILQKDRSDVSDYLNLTPFIIDENALTGDQNSKLFFYAYHDDVADTYHYVAVNDADDVLIVSGEKYPTIKAQCEEFRDTVYRK